MKDLFTVDAIKHEKIGRAIIINGPVSGEDGSFYIPLDQPEVSQETADHLLAGNLFSLILWVESQLQRHGVEGQPHQT